jgi:RNA polymerase sigma-70 factor (ECF subfamily)
MAAVQADGGSLDHTLRAAQAGDITAFNTLVTAYQRQVYNVCYRTLGSPEDAADATQDAFLSAFRGLKTFRGPAAGLRGWLLRVAINACYDQLRRRQRRPAESLDALSNPDPDQDSPGGGAERLADPGLGPEQQTLGAESARAIQQALDQLSTEHRLTVVLCDVQGLSYDEAAHIMQVELGTVKSRLSRARAQLRTLLLAAGELPATAGRLQQRSP